VNKNIHEKKRKNGKYEMVPIRSRYKQKQVSIEVRDMLAYNEKMQQNKIARHKIHQASVTK